MKPYNRTIFRRKAWETYVGKQEQTVLPRLVTPRVFVFFWLLLGLLLGAGSIAWWVEIPTYAAGSGILREQPVSSGGPEMTALIFVPASHFLPIETGSVIRIQTNNIGSTSSGQVEKVEPGLISPQEAR